MGIIIDDPPRDTRVVAPALPPGFVRFEDGNRAKPPSGWALLPPGDAMLTRRVKAAGPTWTVQEKKGRKLFSRGIWAPADIIERERAGVDADREDPAYQKKLDAGRARRAAAEEVYAEDFRGAVLEFLAFAPLHQALAARMADAIAAHATPVGSGTVARTQRIPIEQRAEAAVIAWMRHQTTAYDHMHIERIKGRRREVRAELARESRRLLTQYRAGRVVDPETCPLQRALGAAPV